MKYPIGYTYRITENGIKLKGTIIKYIDNEYLIKWSDGTETQEMENDIS